LKRENIIKYSIFEEWRSGSKELYVANRAIDSINRSEEMYSSKKTRALNRSRRVVL
jgi:hypothetical protein